MSIFNIFREQLSSVIQWENPNPDLLWYTHPSKRDEIKNASKLIVAPGQGCTLVYEGKIVNVINEEGTYNLETDNHPFITTLINLRQNFESEHKLFIHFYRRAQVVNQFWGTATPIKYVDAVFDIPVEMGANGNFSYQISDPVFFLSNIVGSKHEYSLETLREVISERIPQLIAAEIAEKKYSYQQIDGHLQEIAKSLQLKLNEEYKILGLQLLDFRITGTQFDEQTKERIGRVADITADVLAAQKAGLDYVELEKLRALRDAARNEGGLAGAGLQLGVGMELGKKFSDQTDELLSKGNPDIAEKLRKLKILLDEKIISETDFEAKKKELLNKL